MQSIAVVYQSKYGSTKQYATWIAQELSATLLERSSVHPSQLDAYDIVIYGGGLYAGGIGGVQLVTKRRRKKLVLFTVGLGDPANADYSDILNKNLGEHLQKETKVFHLRGGIDYKNLGTVHKCMMAVMKKLIEKKSVTERNEEDTEFLRTYGGQIDFTNKASIEPIVEYVRSL